MSPDLQEGRVGAAIGAAPVGRAWRAFFWLAALFNFAIGLMSVFSPASDSDARVIGVLVTCFGIVYAVVARDPRRFAPALWAGLVGKVGVVALLGPEAFGSGGDGAMAGILVCDGLFALGFLIFLLTLGKDARA